MEGSSSGEVGDLVDLKPAFGEVGPVSHHRKCKPGNDEAHDHLEIISDKVKFKSQLLSILLAVFRPNCW